MESLRQYAGWVGLFNLDGERAGTVVLDMPTLGIPVSAALYDIWNREVLRRSSEPVVVGPDDVLFLRYEKKEVGI